MTTTPPLEQAIPKAPTLVLSAGFAGKAAQAEDALTGYRNRGYQYSQVCRTLASLEHERSRMKSEAIQRLCQLENPATPNKCYSATQAADFALLDPAYSHYKRQVGEFQIAKLEAEIEMRSAELRVELALAIAKQEGGLR